jgi:hypothetical protein
MNTFSWRTRLKYAMVAGGVGWLVGWLVSFPFELSVAWRYVDGHTSRLPRVLAEGLMVWAAFTLFMALLGFVPLLLPALLLLSPRWIVRWRRLLIPGAPVAASVAMDGRMGLLHHFYFRHPAAIGQFFFSAPNFFAVSFALVVVWGYVVLAQRRLDWPR